MRCCACESKIDTVKGSISYLLSCMNPNCHKKEQWDIFSITMKLTGKSFPESVKYLSELSNQNPVPASVPEKKRMKRVILSMFQKEKVKQNISTEQIGCEI